MMFKRPDSDLPLCLPPVIPFIACGSSCPSKQQQHERTNITISRCYRYSLTKNSHRGIQKGKEIQQKTQSQIYPERLLTKAVIRGSVSLANQLQKIKAKSNNKPQYRLYIIIPTARFVFIFSFYEVQPMILTKLIQYS